MNIKRKQLRVNLDLIWTILDDTEEAMTSYTFNHSSKEITRSKNTIEMLLMAIDQDKLKINGLLP